MTTQISIITIDGPSGSGKGTISKLLATKLGWHLLDSGAVYRVLAFKALQQHISLADEVQLAAVAATVNLEFKAADNVNYAISVWLDGNNVTDAIRQEEIGVAASKISAFKLVRQALVSLQHSFAKKPGLVADGRDMGTVIFPKAQLKIYLEADALERAKRRHLQLSNAGQNVNLSTLLDEITKRDERDKNRAASPLKPAADAVVIDTSATDIDDVFALVWQHVERAFL